MHAFRGARYILMQKRARRNDFRSGRDCNLIGQMCGNNTAIAKTIKALLSEPIRQPSQKHFGYVGIAVKNNSTLRC